MEQTDQASKRQKLIAYISRPDVIIFLISVVGGIILYVVNYFSPIGKVDLTIWIQQEIPIILASDAGPLPLTLKYEDENISHATVLKIRIYNSGRTAIGENGQWSLILKTGDSSRMILLDKPITNPSNLGFTIIKEGEALDHLNMNIGLLNPNDDSIDIRIMILDPKNAEHPEIIAETRVPNLAAPIVTRETLEERVNHAYQKPIIGVLWVAFFLVLIWDDFKNGTIKTVIKTVWRIPLLVIKWLFLSLFAASFFTIIISWILTRILFLQLTP